MSTFNSEAFYAAFYWGPRLETFGQCAKRLKTFLHSIGEIDPVFHHWHEYSGSLKKPPPRLRTSKKALEELVSKRWMRTDIDRKLVEDGGCELTISNYPTSTEIVSLSIGCGAGTDAFPNACLVYLPAKGDARARLLDLGTLLKLVAACIESWEPLNGLVTTDSLMGATYGDATIPEPLQSARVGWLTYLSAMGYEAPSGIRSPSHIVPIGSQGYVIVAMDEQPVLANASHIRILRNIAKRLQGKTRKR